MKIKPFYLFPALIIGIISHSFGQESVQNKSREIEINPNKMRLIGTVDERFQSFNVEMCEVIGGDFWIPYTLIDSVRKNSDKKGFAALKWKIEPINLYEQKLRNLASALGPTYVRVSGTWANTVYFQNNDQAKLAVAPDGFKNVLTRQQWKGVIDFCKTVDGKLVTSFPISEGMKDNGNWKPDQVKSILDYTKSIGGEIVAAELFNEPSHASHGDAPKGYNGANFAKDFDAFRNFAITAAPNMKIIGPGSTGEGGILPAGLDLSIDKLLGSFPNPKFDVFTYHFYGTVSQRCMGGQKIANALSPEWLSRTEKGLEFYQKARDKYVPGAPIWLTETAETACGGNPWAATYIDSFRYLEQLGRLAKKGVQVVMHNTLARSEYALLDHDTHDPRPNYWSALLWNKFMGTQVYDAGSLTAGVDIFAHNLKNSKNGRAILVINTTDKETSISISSNAKQYLMTADELVTKKVRLNGDELSLTSDNNIPVITGKKLKKGKVQIPAHSILFLTFEKV
jgi:heparanase 1